MRKSTTRRRFVTGLTAGASGIIAAGASQLVARPAPKVAAQFLGTFGRAAELNMAFADAMPGDKYGFRPVPEIRTYAEQLLHVAGSNVWFTSTYITGAENPGINFEPEAPSKEAVTDLMKQSDDFVKSSISGMSDEEMAEIVETFAGEISKSTVCWLMRDHMTHHRGQMIIYLRMNGMAPPEYVGV